MKIIIALVGVVCSMAGSILIFLTFVRGSSLEQNKKNDLFARKIGWGGFFLALLGYLLLKYGSSE